MSELKSQDMLNYTALTKMYVLFDLHIDPNDLEKPQNWESSFVLNEKQLQKILKVRDYQGKNMFQRTKLIVIHVPKIFTLKLPPPTQDILDLIEKTTNIANQLNEKCEIINIEQTHFL